MNLRLLILTAVLFSAMVAVAQDPIDVTTLTASTKNYIFSDQKSTVKAYIYQELRAKSTCCGTDRIYLEVKIDPTGHVLMAKTLTGKNECFKQSAIDIVKSIKWDASDFRGPKSIYFEITPEIDCENRSNSYAVIEVFNNPLLDKQGNRTYENQPAAQPAPSQPVAAQPAPPQPAPVQDEPVTTPATTQPVAAQPEPAQPAATQPKPDPVPAQQPAASQPALAVQPTPQPSAKPAQPAAPISSPPQGASQTPTSSSDPAAMASTGDPVKDAELAKLKQQMEEFRKQEAARLEKERQKALAEEKRRQQNEARQQSQTAVADRAQGKPGNRNNGTSTDDWAPAASLDSDYSEPRNRNADRNNNLAVAQNSDPIRDQITRLEQQRRELEQNRQKKIDEQRKAEMATDEISQNLLRIEEELLRKQEEAEQMREQRELDQMEQDRRLAEEQRIREQDEYKRMMDEIARLQREADQKIRELEDQKTELDRIAELKQRREQEIVLQRTIREKEQETRLEQMRLELVGSGIASAAPSNLSSLILTAQDSDKFVVLITELQMLRSELAQLQGRILFLEGQDPAKPASANPRGVAIPGRPSAGASTRPDAGVNNAATNLAWQTVDNGVSTGKYVPPAPSPSKSATTDPAKPTQGYTPGVGYSPAPDHRETHANVPVAKPATPSYIGGSDALKAYLSEELHKVGVCGLAQAAFSVTVAPGGEVISGSVLKANTPLVAAQLTNLIRTLKFTPFEGRVPQNLTLEFKGDIKCGTGENVDLQSVQPLIRP